MFTEAMWIKIKNRKTAFFVLVVLFFLQACSTKKNNFVTRKYHGTTAKYNGYFNGKESLKEGLQKLEESVKEDYSEVLPVYKIGNLNQSKVTHSYMNKSIEKGSIVIQHHAITIKGKEYNKWIDDNYMMIGQAYFYKGEWDEAIKTFNFIKETYKKNPIKYEASLWLARCLAEKGDFVVAEREFDQLQNDKKFPEKLNLQLSELLADFYLKQDNFILAQNELNTAVRLTKKRKKRIRYYYILAQLAQQQRKFEDATSYYQKVIRLHPEYEMEFYSIINMSQCIQNDEKNSGKTRKTLEKLLNDEKNKEYLGQIYFALAKMDLTQEDTLGAIKNFKLSAEKSEFSELQKTNSFLEVATIYFTRKEYLKSAAFYDSTIVYMDVARQDYHQIKEKQGILSELATFHQTISLQDSLQLLARLSPTDLENTIAQIIEQEKQRELEKQQEERAMLNNNFSQNIMDGRDNNFGQQTSGGKWYFYNPATLSFGHSEFVKKWGKRKNEDDWRRSDKKSYSDLDSNMLADGKNDSTQVENKKDPKYYLDKIPLSKEQQDASNLNIMEACFQASLIYKNYLQEDNLANNMLLEITKRFPTDENYTPLAYYNLYYNYTEQEKNEKAAHCKTILKENFPQSKYNMLLNEDGYLAELEKATNEKARFYEQTFICFINKDYDAVIQRCDEAKSNEKYQEFFPKYDLLRAFATYQSNDSLGFVSRLEKIVKVYPDTKEKEKAEEILAVLKNPAKMQKINLQASTGTSYIYNETQQHYFVLLVAKDVVDINYIKTLLSDYHSSQYPLENYEISSILFGTDKHLVMVKSFNNKGQAFDYFKSFSRASGVNRELAKTDSKSLIISAENFPYFYQHKDIEGYFGFFQFKYFDQISN